MKFATLLALVALLGCTTAFAAAPETSNLVPQKSLVTAAGEATATRALGGDTFATAYAIPSLPFTDTGDTRNYTDQIEWGYGTAPDVFYSFTPDVDGCVMVDLCNSDPAFDSQIWVVAADQSTVIAFNEDGNACSVYQSQLWSLNVFAGVLYYYIIDGWGSDGPPPTGSMGPFEISITWRDCPLPVECPATGVPEGEPCADPYTDNYNGGCNSTPPAFSDLGCVYEGQTLVICGTTFNYYSPTGSAYCDTDWYKLVDIFDPAVSDLVITTGFDQSTGQYYMILADPATCGVLGTWDGAYMAVRQVYTSYVTPDPTYIDYDWIIFQSKDYYDPTWYPCTSPESWPYVLTIDGYDCAGPPVPAESDTWGGVKSLFR